MTERHNRQSFLGNQADYALQHASIAIIGLGGGGSHIAQQLAHVGIKNFVLLDPDTVETSNLNRLIGATERDAEHHTAKTDVARQLIVGIQPHANVATYTSTWQLHAMVLRDADIIISCVDTYAARHELEATARRYLIPLIDIGMDVHHANNQHHIAGQVILSIPDGPCMQCLGFLNHTVLEQEAQHYGAAGGRPQVVWANGVLASAAVGITIDLLTGWNNIPRQAEYLHYDGNRQYLWRSPRLEHAPTQCHHYPPHAVGEPVFR